MDDDKIWMIRIAPLITYFDFYTTLPQQQQQNKSQGNNEFKCRNQ